jgi:hypothetical protein
MKMCTTLAIKALRDTKLLNRLYTLLMIKKLARTGRFETNHLKTLMPSRVYADLYQRKWINVDSRFTFVRNLDRITIEEKVLPSYKVVVTDRFFANATIFKAFLTTCAFISILRYQQRRKGKKRKPRPGAAKNWNGSTNGLKLPSLSYPNPVSVRYFANYVGISVGTAHKLRKLAMSYRFISVRKKYREFEIYSSGKLRSPRPDALAYTVGYFPELKGRIFECKKQLYYRQPDQIFVNI